MSPQQFLRVLRARWLLILLTILITVGATIAVSLLLPPRYTATATVLVDFKGLDPISGGAVPTLPMSVYLATQVDVIKSHNVARRAVDVLKLADNPAARDLFMKETGGRGNIRDWLADLLLKHLDIDPSRDSTVINIGYSGNDPRFSSAVANAFVHSYITTNLELKTGPARETNVFFNEQIKTMKGNLERAQSRLSEFQREKGIIATDERLDVESMRLNDLSSQLVGAQAQTYDSVSRQRQVQELIARGQVPDTLPDVLANPVIQSLKTSLAQLETKQNDLTTRVGRNHPAYQAVNAEIAGVKRQLLDEMKTISSALAASASLAGRREGEITESLAAQRAKVLHMKQVREDQAILLREVDAAQRAYDAATGRMTQTRLESQTTQTNVTILNEAIEPMEPSFPRLLLNTALSLVLGTMLAVGFALLREMSDRIVRSEADIVDALGIPLLGVFDRQSRRARRRSLAASPAALLRA
jgi:polysaccharide biosynthesis transport protein